MDHILPYNKTKMNRTNIDIKKKRLNLIVPKIKIQTEIQTHTPTITVSDRKEATCDQNRNFIH